MLLYKMFLNNWLFMHDSLNNNNMNIFYMNNMLIMIFIVFFVYEFKMKILFSNEFISMKYFENELLEFLWTLLPGYILLKLGIPSIELLYDMEMKNNFSLTVKIVGNQWYWTYDYVNFKNLTFDCFMKDYNNMTAGDFRLLETDNSMLLPFKTNVMGLITSNDVIHSWAIPSLNIKMDANPGRLNSFFIFSKFPGIFYGQCSEICGANHSFMPIKLEMVSPLMFKNWSMIFSE